MKEGDRKRRNNDVEFSVYLFDCMSVVCMTGWLSVCLLIYRLIFLTVRLCIFLPIYLPIYISM